MLALETAIVLEIGGDDSEHSVAIAEHDVALDHFGELLDRVQKMVDRFSVLRFQPDAGEEGHLQPDLDRIEHRYVPLDDTRLLQQPHPPETGRWRQPDLIRQIGIGYPPIALQSP